LLSLTFGFDHSSLFNSPVTGDAGSKIEPKWRYRRAARYRVEFFLMKILKAKYENGQVKLTEPAPEPGPVDVEVVFLDRGDRRWDEIIRDPGPRPALCAEANHVLEDYRVGKTAPLDPEKL
jgi:hypothetical protein